MELDSTIIVALITGGVTIINIVVSNITSAVGQKKATKRAEEIAAENNQNEKIAELENGFGYLKEGLQALLRAEIIRSHEKYSAKGYCPVYAKEALTRCYRAYHNLGGNDVATELYEQLMDLPVEP